MPTLNVRLTRHVDPSIDTVHLSSFTGLCGRGATTKRAFSTRSPASIEDPASHPGAVTSPMLEPSICSPNRVQLCERRKPS